MTDLEHPAAVQYTVERYLLDELSPPERDAFEEHYFGCPECAEELRVTAAFLSAARRELRRDGMVQPLPEAAPAPSGTPDADRTTKLGRTPKPGHTPEPDRTPPLSFLWRPAVLAPLAAALLLALAYQEVIVFPRARSEIARLSRPETLTIVSLIGANSRGGAMPTGAVEDGAAVLLSFDVPAAERFASYSADLVNPAGKALWSVPVSADQAKDTVALRVPADHWEPGGYTLIVRGHAAAEAAPTVLARYKFTMKGPG